jgi:hypothetical protein
LAFHIEQFLDGSGRREAAAGTIRWHERRIMLSVAPNVAPNYFWWIFAVA